MEDITSVIEEAREAVEKERQEQKDKARVMRHVARKPFREPLALLTPEKRAYMKRFGSRPAKKRERKIHVQTQSNPTP